MTLHLHRILALMPLALLAASCVEPPLYLRKNIQTYVVIEPEIDLTVYWQADWQLHWTFPWNEETLGPLLYSEPASMRLHTYLLNAEGDPKSHNVHNFYGRSAVIPITTGVYDLIFHNNDSEALRFTEGEQLEDIHCTTRVISSGIKGSSPVLTLEQKEQTKAASDEPGQESVALMPDPLYTLYDPTRVISDDLADYEYINGRYVLRIEGQLQPETYIYLIQVHLLNNYERVIGSNGGAALTGVSAGVDIKTRQTDASTVSVMTDAYFSRSTDQYGIRMLTFGIPGCDPYDTSSVEASESSHFLVLNITYFDTTWRNIRIDITDKVRELPLGGVINLELDVDDFPPEGAVAGSGFQAIIDNWQEIHGTTTIIF